MGARIQAGHMQQGPMTPQSETPPAPCREQGVQDVALNSIYGARVSTHSYTDDAPVAVAARWKTEENQVGNVHFFSRGFHERYMSRERSSGDL
jgi:hypothetical protein